jgi:hypothetical protein
MLRQMEDAFLCACCLALGASCALCSCCDPPLCILKRLPDIKMVADPCMCMCRHTVCQPFCQRPTLRTTRGVTCKSASQLRRSTRCNGHFDCMHAVGWHCVSLHPSYPQDDHGHTLSPPTHNLLVIACVVSPSMCSVTRRYCMSIHPRSDTPCTHLVVSGQRYLIFPELGECCKCCSSAGGCGILDPNWLDAAEYTGQVRAVCRIALLVFA